MGWYPKFSPIFFLTSKPFNPRVSWLILVSTLLISIPIIGDGYPHVFHPDEPNILKNSIKRFYQISQGDFYASLLLYEWLIVVWLGIGCLLGLLFQFWSSFSDFFESLIVQTGPIVIWARLLSVLLTSIGHIIVFHFFTRFTQDVKQQLLIGLCLVFNPFCLSTLFWIKFDAIVYLYITIALVLCYRYIVMEDFFLQKYIYALGILALAVRIEVILIPGIVGMYDTYHFIRHHRNPQWDRRLLSYCLIACCLLCFITLSPLTLGYHLLNQEPTQHLAYGANFGESILRRIFSNTDKSNFTGMLWTTLTYFLSILGSVLGPFAIVVFVQQSFSSPPIRYFAICVCIQLIVLTIFGVPFFRYTLLPAFVILFISMIHILKENKPFNQVLFLIYSLYLISSGIQYVLVKATTTDPRLLAKTYLLEISNPSELIAMETLSAKGFYVPIEECEQDMLEKSKLAKELSPTGGYVFDVLLQKPIDQNTCRRLMDICEVNYLSTYAKSSNRYINTYDTLHFLSQSPALFVSSRSKEKWAREYPSFQPFYSFIQRRYTFTKEFSAYHGTWDPRVKLMLNRVSIFVYEKQ